jgi:16S rRNA U516 pseudouridylate synthase RsuA-like enzyme
MSELGLCSRREADEWIENGWVKVDGLVMTTLGTRVPPDAKIEIDDAAHKHQSEQVTILLNKPIGYVSGQAEDGYQPASVLIRAETRWPQDGAPLKFKPSHMRGLAPAGRLDIDSTGLLVFTQDGRVAADDRPDSEVEKEYPCASRERCLPGDEALQRARARRRETEAGARVLVERAPAALLPARRRNARSGACASWSDLSLPG